jgi:hypothetical protein
MAGKGHSSQTLVGSIRNAMQPDRARPQQNKPPRIEVPGPVTYFLGQQRNPGWLLNVNQAGLLVAVAKAEPTGRALTLQFPVIGGGTFYLPAKVVRTIEKKTPIHGFVIVLGLQFNQLDETETEQLGWILESQASRSSITLGAAREILTSSPDILRAALSDDASDAPVIDFFGEITPAELRAFSGQGPVEILARDLILLRIQLKVFKAIVPAIVGDPSNLASTFAPLLTTLLARLDDAELRTEETTLRIAELGGEENRKILNELSTRLDEPRVNLYSEIARRFSDLEKTAWGKVASSVVERLEKIRSARRKSDTDAGFHTPLANKKGETTGTSRTVSKYPVFSILFVATILAIAAAVAWVVALPHFRLNGYDIPLQGISSTYQGGVLVVRTNHASWRQLSAENRDKTLSGIQAYMLEKRVRSSKILAEDSKIIAAILSAPPTEDGKLAFTRRVYE